MPALQSHEDEGRGVTAPHVPGISLLRLVAKHRKFLALTIYAGAAGCSYVIAHLLRFEFQWPVELTSTFLVTLPVLLAVRALSDSVFRIAVGRWRYVGVGDVVRLMGATGFGTALFFFAVMLMPLNPTVPRSIILLEWVLTTYLTAGIWITYRVAHEFRRQRNGSNGQRITAVIVGVGEAGSGLAREMLRRSTGYRPIAFVDDNPFTWGTTVHGVEVDGLHRGSPCHRGAIGSAGDRGGDTVCGAGGSPPHHGVVPRDGPPHQSPSRDQLEDGKPLTVTHAEVERFFMTIPEATQLVLQSSLLPEAKGMIVMLEMGEPVRILDLARKLIRLAGRKEGVDTEVEFIGLRPGEKMSEELTAPNEVTVSSSIDQIRLVQTDVSDKTLALLEPLAAAVEGGSDSLDADGIRRALREFVSGGEVHLERQGTEESVRLASR